MISFTLRQLEIFIAVARYCNITEAARALHLTQPAISRQIHKLESQCGKVLIEQLGKKIHLTESGSLLLARAKRIIQEAENLKESLADTDTELSGSLNMCIAYPMKHIIFDILGGFCQLHPKVKLNISIGTFDYQLKQLYENDKDFCLSVSQINMANLKSEPFFNFPMYLMVSKLNKLSSVKVTTLKALSKENFIVGDQDSNTFNYGFSLLSKLKKHTGEIIRIDNQDAIKHAVQANLGVSYLSKFMTADEIEKGLLFPLEIKDFTPPIASAYWVQHEGKFISPTTLAFKKFLFKNAKKYKK